MGTCRESSQGTPRTFCSSFLGITPLEHPSVYPPIHPFAGPLCSGPVLGPPAMRLHGPERQALVPSQLAK